MPPGPNTWESNNLQDSQMQLQLRLHLLLVAEKPRKGYSLRSK